MGGITAQQLRYVEILLQSPWRVDLDEPCWRGSVQIARPVRFVAQKLLVLRRRTEEKRVNDILYIYDTLQVFGARLKELRAEWEGSDAPELPRMREKLRKELKEHFGRLTNEIRQAERIGMGRKLSAEELRKSCEFGLRELFG